MKSALWTLYEPKDPAKKWAVRVPSGSGRGGSVEVKFGARGYEDFTTHKDVDRRERYRTRHQHDRIDDPYTPGFWSWWALWGEKDDLNKAFADAVQRAKAILGDNMIRHNPDAERVAFSIIMGPSKGMKQRIIDFALRLSDDEVERVSTTFSRQGPAIWRYWSKALDERKKAGKGVPSWARENPVRETFDFTRYEEYAARLSNEQLHYAIEDARRALEVARTWNDGGAGEAKYSDQLGVLQQERRRRQSRSNPEWAKSLGRGLYKGARYAGEAARDLYEGAKEAHSAHPRSNPVRQISPCARQYLETVLFVEADDEGAPLNRSYSVSDFSDEAIQQAEHDCAAFMERAGDDVSSLSDSEIGHNFWLNRNRHGTGFQDLGLGSEGERLRALAKSFGEVDVYVGDDGELYLSR
ncbi:MAG: hypothetical protein EBS90_07640 [Betaproteobacteria bacterium]|nr:hypothetical protein [Betaproteobacteria bacterium]